MTKSNIDNRVRSATFEKKVEVAPDTYEFYFKIKEDFKYLPGQYVWLQFPEMKYEDLQGDRRAMSILNTPNEENRISFLFRTGTSGFKKQILDLKNGDELNIIGPHGSSFCIPENNRNNLILISGGVGVAPFLNLIRYATENNIDQKIKLFSIHDKEKTVLYESELREIEKKNKNKNINIQTIHGDFNTKTFQKHIVKNNIYYVSGPQLFVDNVYNLLSDLGVSASEIHFENFFPKDAAAEILSQKFKRQSFKSDDKENILFTGIQDSSHHLIITDKNGIILFANKAAERITGFTFDEMKGNTPRLWGGLMSNEFYKKLWASKLNGDIVDEQIINRRKNGEIYYVISHISPIKNQEGAIIGFIATEEDITSIKKQEEFLIQANQDLERFALLSADRELKLIELKKEVEKLKQKLDEK